VHLVRRAPRPLAAGAEELIRLVEEQDRLDLRLVAELLEVVEDTADILLALPHIHREDLGAVEAQDRALEGLGEAHRGHRLPRTRRAVEDDAGVDPLAFVLETPELELLEHLFVDLLDQRIEELPRFGMEDDIGQVGDGGKILEDILLLDQHIELELGDLLLFLGVDHLLHDIVAEVEGAADPAEHIEYLLIVDDLFADEPRTLFEEGAVLDLVVLVDGDQLDEVVHLAEEPFAAAVLLLEEGKEDTLLLLVELLLAEELLDEDRLGGDRQPLLDTVVEEGELVLEATDAQRVVHVALLEGRDLVEELDEVELILEVLEVVVVGFDLGEDDLKRTLLEEAEHRDGEGHRCGDDLEVGDLVRLDLSEAHLGDPPHIEDMLEGGEPVEVAVVPLAEVLPQYLQHRALLLPLDIAAADRLEHLRLFGVALEVGEDQRPGRILLFDKVY